MSDVITRAVSAGTVELAVDLAVPKGARGVVVFAHGSGSSRLSPRNRAVAYALRSEGMFGTLLFDLLTEKEDLTYANRFEIGLLTQRLVAAGEWLEAQPEARGLPLGLFGASTGAAAALAAAVVLGSDVRAVVSRGGRPDLAAQALPHVMVPTLLIVGQRDPTVIDLNEQALHALGSQTKALQLVPGATHLFEEPGALDRVIELTQDWFERYLV